MFKFNNTHIFTGYLKQLLSSVHIPTCKIYTREFAQYAATHGIEDPRVLESFDSIKENNQVLRIAARNPYLKGNKVSTYFCSAHANETTLDHSKALWKNQTEVFYDSNKNIPGLTRVLHSPGIQYDTTTHEYLGDYLRFMRDYHNINLMSLYNCFNNQICNNITFNAFNSYDAKYYIYAIPVKLFSKYTIAIDCDQGIEMFCGLYKTFLYGSKISNDSAAEKAQDLYNRTYLKTDKMLFSQPIVFDKLAVENWGPEQELTKNSEGKLPLTMESVCSRHDIAGREQDLKLFVKIPVTCKSTITILEGDYSTFNNYKYFIPFIEHENEDGSISVVPKNENAKGEWIYQQNQSVINFADENTLNVSKFTPISKLQLLAINSGESYPFADRLVEYLTGSAILPIDELPDNIKRVQKVLSQNRHYFKVEGAWEEKIQKIIYDYVMNAGPKEVITDLSTLPELEDTITDPQGNTRSIKYYAALKLKDGSILRVKKDNHKELLIDKRTGYINKLGHNSKSAVFDVLGYVDRDAEKWYASWRRGGSKAELTDTILNTDIYNGLFDIQ